MRTILGCAVLLSALVGAQAAEPRYDTRLEQAVMDIIAKRIGDIRTGFGFQHVVAQVPHAQPRQSLAAKKHDWRMVTAESRGRRATVGSIVTYFAAPDDQGRGGAGLTHRHPGQMPRVLKF